MVSNFKTYIKNRKSKSERIQQLIDVGLDTKKEDREKDTKNLTVRDRVLNSLIWSDNKQSDSVYQNMKNCKKFNLKYVNNRSNKLFGKVHKDWVRDEDGKLIGRLKIDPNNPNLNLFRDKKDYISKYVNSKNICNSLWCLNCRKFLVETYRKRIMKRLNERLLGNYEEVDYKHSNYWIGNFVPTPFKNEDLKHISGVLGICSVNENEVKKLIKEDNNKWRRIRYRLNKLPIPKLPFIEVVYEFELVNWDFLKNSKKVDFKSKQIKQIMEHQRYSNNVFLFVHFHSISNLTKSEIDFVFEKEYFIGSKPLIKTNKNNGLYVQNFNTKQSLEENVDKLTSYPFKNPYRFKHNFRGSDYKNGEYYSFDELSEMIILYHNIQKRNWRGLFRSVEHLVGMDMLKYSRLYPPKHTIWGTFLNESEYFRYKDKNRKHKLLELNKVWVVDTYNNVYMSGWDPNNFFPNKEVQIVVTKKEREILRREPLPPNHPIQQRVYWKKLTKIVYKNVGESEYRVNGKLEDFFYVNFPHSKGLYSTLHKEYKLKKIFKKGRLYIDGMFYGEDMKYKTFINKHLKVDTSKIGLDLEFDLSDPNYFKRMETLIRLDKIDQQKYLIHLFKNRKN